MCIEQCTSVAFLGPQSATKSLVDEASSQTPLGELTALLQPQLDLRGLTLRPARLRGVEGKGEKVIVAPK